jgi:hypothetical protein
LGFGVWDAGVSFYDLGVGFRAIGLEYPEEGRSTSCIVRMVSGGRHRGT